MASVRLTFRRLVEPGAPTVKRRGSNQHAAQPARERPRYATWFSGDKTIQSAAAGAYVFAVNAKQGQKVIYVGSAAGKPGVLAQTIRRHLSKWSSNRCTLSTDSRCPGLVLSNPRGLLLAVVPVEGKARARALEKALIEKLNPSLNLIRYVRDGRKLSAVPF